MSKDIVIYRGIIEKGNKDLDSLLDNLAGLYKLRETVDAKLVNAFSPLPQNEKIGLDLDKIFLDREILLGELEIKRIDADIVDSELKLKNLKLSL